MSSFKQFYARCYRLFPYSLAFGTCYIKGSIADTITQTQVEKRNIFVTTNNVNNKYNQLNGINCSNNGNNNVLNELNELNELNNDNSFDCLRNVKFSLYSGVYCGSIQHFIYNVLYPRLFPGSSLIKTLMKSLFDNFLHIPFLAAPLYFITKSLFMNDDLSNGLNEFWNKKWDILVPYWKIFLPTIFCIMYFIPFEFRVLSIGIVSVAWLAFLSFKAPME